MASCGSGPISLVRKDSLKRDSVDSGDEPPSKQPRVTPFSIVDILAIPTCNRQRNEDNVTQFAGPDHRLSPWQRCSPTSSDCAFLTSNQSPPSSPRGRSPPPACLTRISAAHLEEEDTGSEDNSRKKKTRTVFSRSQIFTLESTFDAKRYLSSAERTGLAINLKISEGQVKIWFQNRRNKWKKQMAVDLECSHQRLQTLTQFPQMDRFYNMHHAPMALSSVHAQAAMYSSSSVSRYTHSSQYSPPKRPI